MTISIPFFFQRCDDINHIALQRTLVLFFVRGPLFWHMLGTEIISITIETCSCPLLHRSSFARAEMCDLGQLLNYCSKDVPEPSYVKLCDM
jgi:hypothetical protein